MINHIARACQEDGSYTISAGTMNPAVVFARLLDTLAILAPAMHGELTAPGGAYVSIPRYALAHELSPWWDSEEAAGVIKEVIGAINDAAPNGFACQLTKGERWVLTRIDDSSEHDGSNAESSDSEPPPHVSALRARVRPRS
jgi:hypothetical protein